MAANSEEPDEPVTGACRDPLFINVNAVCDTAVDSTGADGAAVAILTGTTRVRDLIHATDATAKRLDEL